MTVTVKMRTRKADFDCMVWMGFKKPGSESPVDSLLSWRALIAEYLGTLLLVFLGTLPSMPSSVDFVTGNPSAGLVNSIGGPFAGGFAVGTIVKVCSLLRFVRKIIN